jgi:hypothetical protein
MEIVDNEILTSMATCSTKAMMRHALGYTAKAEKIAAYAGQCVHKALLLHFQGQGKDTCLQTFDALYRDYAAENLVEERLSWENVRTILVEYLKDHPLGSFPFDPIAHYAEKGLLVPLDEKEDLWFFALVDLPARERSTGLLVPVDHKTTGRVTAWWMKKFSLGSQMTGYIWAMRQFFNESCEKAFINVIELSKLPDPVKRKCSTHKVPYAECRHLHAKWELLVTSRSEAHLQDWYQTALFWARRYREWKEKVTSVEMVPFVRMHGTFNNGCTFCEFAAFCKADRSVRMLEGYVVDPWRPWEKEDNDNIILMRCYSSN